MTTDRRWLDGTYRACPPAQTWAAVQDYLQPCGITRVCPVTGLDYLGIPVALAVRPAGRRLSVAQGKGASLLLAQISASMEAIELWHAELPNRAAACTAPARALDLGYDVLHLAAHEGSLLTTGTVLDWLPAAGVVTGRQALAPLAAVEMPVRDPRRWSPPGLRATSNGLASGNTLAEATVHALYELIERHAIAACVAGRAPARVVDGAALAQRCDPIRRLVEAEVWFEVRTVNQAGLPCTVIAYIWSPDLPVLAAGSGCHEDWDTALSRAVTEAAQSRLTVISGTRDDIDAAAYAALAITAAPVPEPADPVPAPIQATGGKGRGGAFESFEAEAAALGRLITDLTGCEPLVVDLSSSWGDLAVCKVIAPGLDYYGRHELPRLVAA